MVSFVLKCLLLLSLQLFVHGILLSRLRHREEPDSNVVPSSVFLFPNPENDSPECKTDHGYPGRCVDVRYCHAARLAIRARSHPIRCGWINNHIPKVCCHPDQVQNTKMVFRPNRNRWRNRNRRPEWTAYELQIFFCYCNNIVMIEISQSLKYWHINCSSCARFGCENLRISVKHQVLY